MKEEIDLGVLFTDDFKFAGQCMQAYKKTGRALEEISQVIMYKYDKGKAVLLALLNLFKYIKSGYTLNTAVQLGLHIMQKTSFYSRKYNIKNDTTTKGFELRRSTGYTGPIVIGGDTELCHLLETFKM